METKDVIYNLRNKSGLSQDELASKLFVTRQAVSRWENGETIPNTDTLKLLSSLFNVSINTLLGSPKQLFCQCCGMPLEDEIISREKDGLFNEEYCKWCYADGEYTYNDMDDLINVCIPHMQKQGFTEEAARSYMKENLPNLNYWKNRNKDSGLKNLELKNNLIKEFNELNICGMPKLESINALVGAYVNLEYKMPNGSVIKLLDDSKTYFGNQLESKNEKDIYFGVIGNDEFLMVSKYKKDLSNPELLIYKKR